MIPVRSYEGKDVAVFGLGRSGIAAARALMAGKARVFAWDDNEAARKAAKDAGVTLADLNHRDWQTFAALVVSPGIPVSHPEPHRIIKMAKMVDVPVLGDIELFAREVAALKPADRPIIIGVTGTNGKSTTTALIGHILKSAGMDVRVGGNIGVGVLDLERLHGAAVYVLELSSYQLELAQSLRCNVAVMLNISADHLERHGGMKGYVAAKSRIFLNQGGDDTAIIGVDDPRSQTVCTLISADGLQKVVPISAEYGLGRGVSVLGGWLTESGQALVEEPHDIRGAATLPGKHNQQNAAAAFAACRAIGLDADEIIEGINTFNGLPHRLQTVGEVSGVRFVNDSKATNAQAAEQALTAYPGAFWIAGGRPKEEGIDALGDLLPSVRKAYLIGEATDGFAAAIGERTDFAKCRTLDVAIKSAFEDAVASGLEAPVILFSPACASFDQFKDYEDRGRAFQAMAADLAKRQRIRETA